MVWCGPAKKCCHFKYTPPTDVDECRCGCGMLNGVFQVMMGQFLLFIGFWFSIATLSDCNFITLLSEDNGDSDGIVVREDGLKSNQIGLLSYLDINTDQCYYWTNNEVQGVSE